MEGQSGVWAGVRPYVATVLGVGIFGLPAVMAQVGLGSGLLALWGAGFLNATMLSMYAELLTIERDRARFPVVVGRQLGVFGEGIAAVALLLVLWGALLAYVVAGGEFVADLTLLPAWAGSLVLWAGASTLAIGGIGVMTRVQKVLLPLFCLALAMLTVLLLPHLSVDHFVAVGNAPWWYPLSVTLFAFAGISALPEMRDMVGARLPVMLSALRLGTFVVALIYSIFITVILGVTGAATSERAIDGLWSLAAPVAFLGTVLGVITTFTAFVSVATSILDTFFYDFRQTHLRSWFFAVAPPLLFFLLGVRNFLPILQVVGGIFGSLLSLLIVLAYQRAKFLGRLPKHALRIPPVLVFLVFLMFFWALIATLVPGVLAL